MSDTNQQTELLRQVRLALQNRDYQGAIKHLEQTVKIAHDAGDVGAEGRHLGNLALIYYRLNQPERSLEYFEKALASAREEGDQATENGLLGNMGNILREVQRYEDAVSYLNQALVIAQEIGDVRGRGIWLGNLGLVYDDLKQPGKAIDYHQKAVEIARRLQDQRGLASRLTNLGNSYVANKDFLNAITQFEEVVEIQRTLGDQREVAVRLGIIGNLYNELGRAANSDSNESRRYFSNALDFYGKTLEIARELDDVISEGQLLRSIGNVLGSLGRFEQSMEYLQAAHQMFDVLGLDEQRDVTQRNINLVSHYQERIDNPSTEP